MVVAATTEIYVLKDIAITSLHSFISTHWKSAGDLILPSHLAPEWSDSISNIKIAGIAISPKEDRLI